MMMMTMVAVLNKQRSVDNDSAFGVDVSAPQRAWEAWSVAGLDYVMLHHCFL